jgi:hypothetical protein
MREILSPSRPVSVRYVLYELVSRGLIPSTAKKHYRSLLSLCLTARISGELDDSCFVDNKRESIDYERGHANLGDYLKPPSIRHYHRNRWQDQPRHVECWLEKNTSEVLVSSAAYEWEIALRISAGSFSRAFLMEAARELDEIQKPIVIFYCGDFDPSGLVIERAAREGNGKQGARRREGLRDILVQQFDWTEAQFRKQIRWKRIAVTESDFRAMDSRYTVTVKDAGIDEQGQETKGDPHAPSYVERYGDRCVEVEALEVRAKGALDKRLKTAIASVVDSRAWKMSEVKEAAEKRTGVSID